VPVGDLPLNMIVTKDERYAILSNSGMSENSLSVVDIENLKEVQRVQLNTTWRGLAFNGDESKLFVSGGNNNYVYVLTFSNGMLTLQDSLTITDPHFSNEESLSITGLDFSPRFNSLYVVSKESNAFYVYNLDSGKVVTQINLGFKCFDIKINHAQSTAYVSVWGNATVAEVDLNTLKVKYLIHTGEHPCDLVLTSDDKYMYVTNANNNTTSVLDLTSHKEIEKLNSALSPDLPFGSTPDAVCIDEKDNRVFIGNADNNYLAVFDVSDKGKSRSLGFIPTGWYPTACNFLSSGKLLVANGKGITSLANPDGPNPFRKSNPRSTTYIGYLLKGTLSVIDNPDAGALAKYSQQVYNNTPFKTRIITNGGQSVIPIDHKTASPVIKHVFYIIKENRTYDQIYGDIPSGNGDSSLCLFGEKNTPNQHTLVKHYTLYDNFYADAEVSADGHNWSTAAYATDYVEKLWPVLYGNRGGTYDFEGGVDIAVPSSGYIWNNVLMHGLSFRNYGEFVDGDNKDAAGLYSPRDNYLLPYTDREYPGFNSKISDVERFKIWEKDLDNMIKKNDVPNLSIMRLPNNHTQGTRPGELTPQAYIAQNDYALGMIVDKISHSPIWKESIIFVVEDDAQAGSDHVDAHRSCLMVISPYVKKNFVDHTMYSTSSVLKTIELVLGIPPMTQYDLSAFPIVNSISDEADLTPYTFIEPSIDMNKKNLASAYGSKRSMEFDLSREDAAPEQELNEIIWKSVKGENSIMPPPVRSAFVKLRSKSADDDDD
jgi:YVTN family beta-propeller protein